MSPLKLEYVSFSTHVIPQVFLFPAIRLFDSFIVYARYMLDIMISNGRKQQILF